ncbi:MAG: DNA replication/repair protein RecF [Lachnospiraceae bacterium]|nr:DNA replication/repair protein RecF [Lachnospiraceae bacterium]
MIIKSLELLNYRNYESLNMEFDSGTNILYGDNAQGKTNILEAVYLSGTTKSHRGSKDKEIISFEKDESHIRTVVEKNDNEYCIDIHLKKKGAKGIAVNKVPIKKARDLFGILNIVVFSPEDLYIIKEGPQMRRRFMDMELCQIDRIYLSDLTKYNKTLLQRNKLLKDLYYRPELKDTLDIWDMQLIETGKKIIARRNRFINELMPVVYDIHKKLTGDKEDLKILYEPETDEESFERNLKENREKDLKFGSTSVGPHHDDIKFLINDTDIRKYGSQGQQRTSALSLKLSEIKIVEEIIKDKPILLMDDVLSELDSSRQNFLLNNITDTQTIVTCTGLDEFIKNRFEIDKIFEVIEGHVYENKEIV